MIMSVSICFCRSIGQIFSLFFFYYTTATTSVFPERQEFRPTLPKSRRKSSPMCSETDEQQESDMVELENSRNHDDDDDEEEEEEESPGLVFKFSYQTETFERLSREGYRDPDSGGFRCSSPPPTTVVEKYETFPSKNLRCVVVEPKAATFRVGESFCESINIVSAEDNGILPGKLTDGESELSVSGKDRTEIDGSAGKNLAEEESCDFPEKILFLIENDFLESTDTSSQTFTSRDGGFLSDSDFEEYVGYDTSPEKDSTGESRNDGKNDREEGSDSEEESMNGGLESLWEHQDLIEQLQMELKKVKAFGLPTIREDEDECPKIVEDLKPWRIEEKKFRHGDTIGELHKFHRSYRERMRKLDILNYQKMYALGLLQSRDPLQAISAVGSSSPPAFSSVFPVKLRLWKPRKPETEPEPEPMVKFITEIRSELENVYVGQMCLSWEILHWQCVKAIELRESDAYGARRYSEVAGEFQQFQVLVQRFIENEPFEVIPRVQHYVKRRCVLRNLLQVPVIREDGIKDRRKGRRRDSGDATYDNAITSEQLVEIMEESIRLFWRFVRSDKGSRSIRKKSRTKSQIKLEDSEKLHMLEDIKSNLQKKEKRLKGVLNSEKCVIRRMKKQKEEDQVLHFFSQVDMKLVTRVLNMSKLTKDHLAWCHNKLSKIHFVNSKIHLDPSFCLFPC